jgi:predicted amidohydrolase YtcJ
MDESYDAAISAVLLGYSALSKAQRAAFMDHLNHFLFVSPQQQRRLASEWLVLCRESKIPSVRMVAESAATYVARNKIARKK